LTGIDAERIITIDGRIGLSLKENGDGESHIAPRLLATFLEMD
jgi:hypothetical protein